MPASPSRTTAAMARRRYCVLALAVLAAVGLTGCGVISKINNIRHAVEGNRTIIKQFTQGLKNTKAMPFQVSYVTTGDSPTTVTYAVRPPNDVAFSQVGSGSGTSQINLISNASGEYSCSQDTSGGQWTCQKLGVAGATAQNALFAIYTPSHWVAFLEAFSIAAGLAGDKVTTSNMSVNGFSMNCIDFTAKDVKGTSTICTTTSQGILGYVKVAGQPASFEIKAYTATPPDSAFQLPAGATVTNNG